MKQVVYDKALTFNNCNDLGTTNQLRRSVKHGKFQQEFPNFKLFFYMYCKPVQMKRLYGNTNYLCNFHLMKEGRKVPEGQSNLRNLTSSLNL